MQRDLDLLAAEIDARDEAGNACRPLLLERVEQCRDRRCGFASLDSVAIDELRLLGGEMRLHVDQGTADDN